MILLSAANKLDFANGIMLYTNNTEKLLRLQGVNVKKVEDNEKSVLIYAEPERKKQIHDYREQTVKPVGGHY